METLPIVSRFFQSEDRPKLKMNFLSQFFTFLCVSFTSAAPAAQQALDSDNDGKISTNELFQQLNEILRQNIKRGINDESVEIGDKIKADHGHLHIQVQQFDAADGFPVAFQPNDDTIIDDVTVIPIGEGDDGEKDYVIKRDTSDTPTHKTDPPTVQKNEKSSTSTVKSVKNPQITSQPSSTTLKP